MFLPRMIVDSKIAQLQCIVVLWACRLLLNQLFDPFWELRIHIDLGRSVSTNLHGFIVSLFRSFVIRGNQDRSTTRILVIFGFCTAVEGQSEELGYFAAHLLHGFPGQLETTQEHVNEVNEIWDQQLKIK